MNISYQNNEILRSGIFQTQTIIKQNYKIHPSAIPQNRPAEIVKPGHLLDTQIFSSAPELNKPKSGREYKYYVNAICNKDLFQHLPSQCLSLNNID